MGSDAAGRGPKLASVVVFVRDLDRSADFYQELLLMRVAVRTSTAVLLVGTDDSQYIRQIQTVAGESYGNFEVGSPVTAMGVAGSRTITYVN